MSADSYASLLQGEMKAIGIYDSAHCGSVFWYCQSVNQSVYYLVYLSVTESIVPVGYEMKAFYGSLW